jgi:hypothetical protein
VGSGWAYSSNTIVKNANGTAVLSQASGSMVTPLVTDELLTLTFTISNLTVGSVTPSIGGVTLTTRSTNGTFTETFRITSTAALTFTPTNTARFTMDNVSLKLAYSGGATQAVNAASATSTYSHYSPPVEWEAQGWSSSSTVTRVIKFRSYLKTSISSPNPIGKWVLEHETNNGGWIAALEYDNNQSGKGFRISTPSAQSNSTAGTTRAVSIENTGSYTHIDMNFSGVTKAAYSANSSGDAIVYTTGSFYIYGGSGTISSLFNLHQFGSFGAYITGVGAFTGRVSAGYGTTSPKNYLQTAGSFGGYGRYVTSNTYTVVDQDFWIYCDTTNANACTGTPASACSSYGNSTDCGNHSVAGCSWNGGNCSDYNGNQGTCEGTSGCTWEMASCNPIGDESSCNSTSGCSWNSSPNDCAPYNSDQMTCEGHSGCMWTGESLSDCSTFNNNEGTCTITSGCSWSPSYDIDCSTNYFDESSCNAVSGCSWDGMTCNGMGYVGNGTCSGMYVSTPASCSGTWYTYLCEGSYSTGNCTGVWGTCVGTASCSPFTSESPCEAETGCTWATGQTIYLPQLSAISENNIGRILKIKKYAGGGAVTITAYAGDNIGGNPTATLSTIGDDFELHGYTINGNCSVYNDNEGGCTGAGGCSWASTCSGYGNEGDCTGNGCSWDGFSCSGGSTGTCSGSYVISKRWHIWGA